MRPLRHILGITYPLAPSISKAVRGLAAALGVSFCLLAIGYWQLAEGFTTKSPWTIDRWRALLDGVLAGLVAFVLVGGFTFVCSLSRPEEQDLDRRIAYLYSARRSAASECDRYLRSQVRLLGAMITDARVIYRALELSADASLVHVSVSTSMTLCNMMRLDRYTQVLPLQIVSGLLPTDVHDFGCVRSVHTTAFSESGAYEGEREWLDCPRKVTRDQPIAAIEIELDIPAGGKLQYAYEYDLWHTATDDYWFAANRFIEFVEMKFSNLTNHEFVLMPNHTATVPGTRTLAASIRLYPGQTEAIGKYRAVSPTENVTFLASTK